MASPEECSKNPTLATPISIEYDLNPLEAATIEFVYFNQVAIGRLVLPSDSIHFDSDDVS